MYIGYKIRIYPTKEQKELIWKHIHASRFIWNYMLALQEDSHNNGEKIINKKEMSHLITLLKKKPNYDWLNDVSRHMLDISCNDLMESYKRFFEGAGHPKFKSRKRSKMSFPIRYDRFYIRNGYAIVPKIGKIKYKSDFIFPNVREYKYLNVRLSFVDNKYLLSFSMEYDKQVCQLTDNNMGIDLGIKELAVVAYGNEKVIIHNINKSKKIRDLNKRIKHLQRIISRKYEASKRRNGGRYEKTIRIEKEEKKLRKLHTRIKNIRQNYLHQVTHSLVKMLPKKVVMEDLNVAGMVKNKYLSRAIQEQCFYEFKRQMKYKCEWRGIEFVLADRFFPSSKTCSCCGAVKEKLFLSERTYICEECHLVIDRDYNAAINLMKYTA